MQRQDNGGGSQGPDPGIRNDELEAVLDLAARLQRDDERRKQGIVSDDVIDSIVASTGISEAYIAEARARLAKSQQRKASCRQRVALGLGVLAMLSGIALVAFFQRSAIDDAAKTGRPPAPVATAAPATGTSGLATIPFEVVRDAASQGLHFHPRHVRQSVYNDSAYLSLALAVRNDGGSELRKLRLHLQWLDAKGSLLKTVALRVVDTHQAELRPGDQLLMRTTQKSDPRLAKLRVAVLERDEVPAPGRYGASEPMEPIWACERPDHLVLDVRRRQVKQTKGIGDKAFIRSVFEFHNRGDGAIKRLKAELRLFDEQDRLLKASDRIIVTTADGMALLPGETALHAWIDQVPDRYHHASLHVLEIE